MNNLSPQDGTLSETPTFSIQKNVSTKHKTNDEKPHHLTSSSLLDSPPKIHVIQSLTANVIRIASYFSRCQNTRVSSENISMKSTFLQKHIRHFEQILKQTKFQHVDQQTISIRKARRLQPLLINTCQILPPEYI